MPGFWVSLKRSWKCKSQSTDIHEPKSDIQTRKPFGFGCSRTVSNLRDIIHGSKRHTENPSVCSPRSLGSTDLLNPITHEIVVTESRKCELKICRFGGNEGNKGTVSSTFVGTLKPGTPRPGNPEMASLYNRRRSCSLARKVDHSKVFGNGIAFKPRISIDARLNEFSRLTCEKCFYKFKTWEDVEEHHLSNHAVTELREGDSSRRIVEIICRASNVHIERVLKVHNRQTTIAQFEEQRELVKMRVSKLPTRHPRCLADGNELLRFHATTIACSLGINGSSTLCTKFECDLCQILRNGFCREDANGGRTGVYTASTSGRALESVEIVEGKIKSARKGLLVCRVIAGRVHKPLENFQEMAGKSSFDSLVGKFGQHSNIEELYLLNPKALLPCFVVIYHPCK